MNSNDKKDSETVVLRRDLLAGRSLKHFQLEGLLGEGGMGVVYRAQDTKLHRPVAVKVLSPQLTSDTHRKQRFLLEARAAARISHPAIAQIYFVDEDAEVTFIAMELVEGKTVRELIQNRELDLLGAIDIAVQVADGLAKAHQLGIVHRDIKPANIMLTGDGHVKILDFGLAKLLDTNSEPGGGEGKPLERTLTTQTQSGMILGTPAYMSPEQVRGIPVDFQADIFSTGVLLFEMACGQSPFQRENLMDTLHAVAFDEAPAMTSIRPDIPDQLQRIVAKCLKKRVEDRYSTTRQLADELRLLRRNTEAGLMQKTAWQQRIAEAWEQLRNLPPSRFAWMGAGAVIVGLALYFYASSISLGGLFLPALAAFIVYRHIRNRPHRVQETFVRRVSKIPEVRLITFRDRQVTVVVDRPVAQLYGRISTQLRVCNRKLYFGEPMTVSILHEIPQDQVLTLMAGPGVQYVREDLTGVK